MNKSEKQYKMMLETPIPKLITKVSMPMVVSMLITVIYNTADTFFVSKINKSASAAVGAVYALMAIIQAVGYGFSMGAGNIISLRLGEKKNDEAEKYASSGFFAALLCGTVIGGVGLAFLSPMLRLLGCSETMLPYAKDYALYVLVFAPINCCVFVMNGVVRACGMASTIMWTMGFSGILNMVLDPIFIFNLDLGAGGASLATALSQTVSFVIFGMLFIRKKTVISISFSKVSRKKDTYIQIITTGIPTVFRQSMGSLAAALLNIRAVIYGDAAVAAVTIANKAYVLVRNIVLGYGQGFQPVAGYNFGANKRKRTWKAFVFTGIVGTGICIVSAVLIAVFARPIMAWFSNDPDVIDIGINVLYFSCAVMPFMGVSTYVNQMYQCLGFKAQATFLASCRQGIFFVPCIFLLPLFFGLVGVKISQPAADLLTFVISVPFLISFYNKEIKGRE